MHVQEKELQAQALTQLWVNMQLQVEEWKTNKQAVEKPAPSLGILGPKKLLGESDSSILVLLVML